MRLRNVKNKEEILNSSKLLVLDYSSYKGKWKKVESNNIEPDFISAAEVWAMKKVIRRWKLYGRWFVKITGWWDSLKWKIKNKITK